MTNIRIFGALATAVATTVGAIASPASAQIAIERVDVDAAGKESSLG